MRYELPLSRADHRMIRISSYYHIIESRNVRTKTTILSAKLRTSLVRNSNAIIFADVNCERCDGWSLCSHSTMNPGDRLVHWLAGAGAAARGSPTGKPRCVLIARCTPISLVSCVHVIGNW